MTLPEMLADLRTHGWMVAVHNDYRVAGKFQTFWLFTHPDGKYVKGEGSTDEAAVGHCRHQVLAGKEGTL